MRSHRQNLPQSLFRHREHAGFCNLYYSNSEVRALYSLVFKSSCPLTGKELVSLKPMCFTSIQPSWFDNLWSGSCTASLDYVCINATVAWYVLCAEWRSDDRVLPEPTGHREGGRSLEHFLQPSRNDPSKITISIVVSDCQHDCFPEASFSRGDYTLKIKSQTFFRK